MKKVAIGLIIIGLIMMGSGFYLMTKESTKKETDNTEKTKNSNKKVLSCSKVDSSDDFYGISTISLTYDNEDIASITMVLDIDLSAYNDEVVEKFSEMDLCNEMKDSISSFQGATKSCDQKVEDKHIIVNIDIDIDKISESEKATINNIDATKVKFEDDDYKCSIGDGTNTNSDINTDSMVASSRKEDFVSLAKEYVNAVKVAWAADDISCGGTRAESLGNGNYIVWFQTSENSFGLNTDSSALSNKTNLLDSSGKSPWGNTDIAGYVTIVLDSNVSYKIVMMDSKKHAITDTTKKSDDLDAEDVVDDVDVSSFPLPDISSTACVVDSY